MIVLNQLLDKNNHVSDEVLKQRINGQYNEYFTIKWYGVQ